MDYSNMSSYFISSCKFIFGISIIGGIFYLFSFKPPKNILKYEKECPVCHNDYVLRYGDKCDKCGY